MNSDINLTPLVSVVIPTYNRADYLKIALTSVINQSYRNLEILILDNRSDDGTQDVIKFFNDTRIKAIRHLVNVGGIVNWIYGINWAAGEYLAILGDDDFYKPDFIKSRVEAFNKFEGIDFVFSSFDTCDRDNIITTKHSRLSGFPRVLRGDELINVLNMQGIEAQIGSCLFRRSCAKLVFSELIHAGKAIDVALQLRIALLSGAAWIPDRGLVYRLHSGQDSRTGGKEILIGHFNAFFEPLIFGSYLGCNESLRRGAWWSIDYLAMNSLLDQKSLSNTRKLFFLALLLRPNYLKSWFRFFISIMPTFIRRWILRWRK